MDDTTLVDAYGTATAVVYPRMPGFAQVWLTNYLIRTHTDGGDPT